MTAKKRFLILLPLSMIVILVIVVIFNTFGLTSRQEYSSSNINLIIDDNAAINRLSKALQYKTISFQDNERINETEFLNFRKYLEASFPNLHKVLQRETINELSLLYKWEGTDNESDAILLMAHMDVVPADTDLEGKWEYPPFSGTIENGYVWGRGALDMKSQLMGILEAVEDLSKQGFKPKKTIYIAIGHDEEVGGKGNDAIASYMELKGIKLSMVLDEGGFVVKNMVPGIEFPVALIGIAEKGKVSLKLSISDNGGHSSIPARHTVIGQLATSINKIESNPFDAKIDGATKEFIYTLAPEMTLVKRIILSNLWLSEPIVVNKLAKSDATDALIRTTNATTLISGGTKENVLPQRADALINFRILPGETVDDVIAKVKKEINNDQIKVNIFNSSRNPTLISDSRSKEFRVIGSVAKTLFPESIITPYLAVAGSDSRYYQKVSKNIYRFSPIELDQESIKTIHGVNERISFESYINLVKFYYQSILLLQE